MRKTSMRAVLAAMVAASVAATWACPTRAEEEGETQGKLSLTTDVGAVTNSSQRDEFWWGRAGYLRPILTASLQSDELSLELRGRALFAQSKDFEDGGTKFTGDLLSWDFRALAGWDWKLDKEGKWTLGALVGGGYRDETKRLNDKTDGIKSKLHYNYGTIEFGPRLKAQLTEGIRWVTEVLTGPVLGGNAERADTDALGTDRSTRDLNGGWLVEARTYVDWRLSKSWSLRTGFTWEQDLVRIKEWGTHRTNTTGAEVGLVLDF